MGWWNLPPRVDLYLGYSSLVKQFTLSRTRELSLLFFIFSGEGCPWFSMAFNKVNAPIWHDDSPSGIYLKWAVRPSKQGSFWGYETSRLDASCCSHFYLRIGLSKHGERHLSTLGFGFMYTYVKLLRKMVLCFIICMRDMFSVFLATKNSGLIT